MNKIVLLDANSLIHRAYHALPSLSNSKGQATGAIYGFLNILLSLIKKENPTHLAAAFDLKGPTFRHTMFEEYKGKRKPLEDALCQQFEPIKKLLTLMKIPVLCKEGFEADDILGTIANRFDEDTIIVTGDRDSFQLVSETTRVFWTKRGISEIEEIDLYKLKSMGFTPKSFIDYKAMRGDPSDNIPGIPSVGEKTAVDLLNKYGTLDEVLNNAENIPGKLGITISQSKEIALLSRVLATININVDVECSLENIAFSPVFPDDLKKYLMELEITSVISRMSFEEVSIIIEKSEFETVYLSSEDEIKAAFNDYKNEVALNLGDELEFAFLKNKRYVVKCAENLFDNAMDFSRAVEVLCDLTQDKYVVAYDLKYLLRFHSFKFKDGFDLMVAAHIARGSVLIKSLQTLLYSEKLEVNACACLQLKENLKRELKIQDLEKFCYELEFPLIFVLAKMESRGIRADIETLKVLEIQYDNRIKELTKSIYDLAGEEFNVGSPRQTADILFNKLNLRSGKKNKTGLSVSEEVLEKIKDEHPIVSLILDWRHLSKLQSTYITNMIPLIKCGKIHTDFRQTVAATGRLSSTNPNLQNLPARAVEAREIKNAFWGTGDNVLVSADYSQIELRLLAHFSGDRLLIDQYKNEKDIHSSTAAQIFKVNLNDVTPDMRRDAKAVNFGIIYGISDFGLATNLSISKKTAKQFIENYFETYKDVKKYLDGNIEFAKENGYCKTMMGRIRRLNEISSGNYIVRSAAERIAMNTPLQGSAADIIKIAMINLEKRLENMKSKMILQIHDELLVDTAQDEVDEVMKIVVEEMENAVTLKVPLTASVRAAKRWGDLE